MKVAVKWIVVWAVGFGMLYAGSDRKAGYNDGCSSGKGHYTRSVYKYRHSKAYHSGWRKGKRACARKVKSRRHTRVRHVRSCNTEVPWEAFRRGYVDGFNAAKRGSQRHGKGCSEYHRGWESGYRSCGCIDQ